MRYLARYSSNSFQHKKTREIPRHHRKGTTIVCLHKQTNSLLDILAKKPFHPHFLLPFMFSSSTPQNTTWFRGIESIPNLPTDSAHSPEQLASALTLDLQKEENHRRSVRCLTFHSSEFLFKRTERFVHHRHRKVKRIAYLRRRINPQLRHKNREISPSAPLIIILFKICFSSCNLLLSQHPRNRSHAPEFNSVLLT